VAPAELESILLSHPNVSDAAVKGVYFSELETEYPAAYITSDLVPPELEQLATEVESFVNKQVAKYKWLRGGVHVVPTIPRK
jgi:acyl-coenzyme A synthetase/AMP-(fatty) acid ligase